MEGDLSNAFAVVVGCESYGLDGWALNGPAFDALDIASWLIQTGMPAENLHLMASPLEQNQAEFDAAAGRRLGPDVHRYQATSGDIKDLFTRRLLDTIKRQGSAKQAGQVLVFWSGHGVVRRHHATYDRVVFCADASVDSMECVAIGAIADRLASQLPSFQLIFLVDACATDLDRLGNQAALSFVGLATGAQDDRPSRFMAYAAHAGQVARNLGTIQRGLFTSVLLHHLRDFRPRNLKEFKGIDAVVKASCETVGAQTGGRQQVVWDMLTWEGHRHYPPPPPVAKAARAVAPVTEAAVHLCDRSIQWHAFRSTVAEHQKRLRGRPMVILSHGERKQASQSFRHNLGHRIRFDKEFGSDVESTIDRSIGDLSLAGEASIHGKLNAALADLLQVNEQDDLVELATLLSAHRSNWLLMLPIRSSELRARPRETLAPLLQYWRDFPDVPQGRVIVMIHIEYSCDQPTPWYRRWLRRETDGDEIIRTMMSTKQLYEGAGDGIYGLPCELSMVTVNDVFDWADRIKHLHDDWLPPTTRWMEQIFKDGPHRAMDEVVHELRRYIRNERHHDNSQAC
jgi:hypothetical protein